MKKILIIDDESGIITILKKYFVKSGYEVLTSIGGEEGLKMVQIRPEVDLIILDIKMPKVTGITIAQEMRKMNMKTPVIFLSGSMGAMKFMDELKKIGYGEDDVLMKPIKLELILEEVKKRVSNGQK
ncbi:MAG: response regulator [Candidatus Omnitrophica bacterium]|nr:response regulator [Candidatus Omnitrophota bacterium]